MPAGSWWPPDCATSCRTFPASGSDGDGTVEGTVARLVVDNDRLQGIELGDGTVIPRRAVFVRPRFVPNADLLTGLGCALDANG